MRLALWDVDLTRKGPGLLLRDINRGEDAQVLAAVRALNALSPDVVILTGFDTDADGRALTAFADLFEGHYPNRFTKIGNEGRATSVDMDGDGTRNAARDTQGFGYFPGNGGIAVMAGSELPLVLEQDFTNLVWRDLPGALQAADTQPAEAQAIQRLSSTSHWVLSAGPLSLLIHAATPPVFDGPEDRNGRRNHDEAALWLRGFEGRIGHVPRQAFALVAKFNVDPQDGEGRRGALISLLGHSRLQDPKPMSQGAREAATEGHRGDPALDTADWDDPTPGNLRVDYILPSADLEVLASGVVWPEAGSDVAAVSEHGIVWVDIAFP